jgi:preprotein translocase subunit SecF
MKGIRLIPEETHLDFIGKRMIAFVLSALMIVCSFYLVATKGLNFGIDFTGGTVIEVRVNEAPDMGALREDLNTLGLGTISLQEFGDVKDLMIRMAHQDGGAEQQQAAIQIVKQNLNQNFGEDGIEYRRVEFVGPQVGEELKRAGMFAVFWSLLGILVYIWVRFEWQFGVAAVAALAHDTIAVLGFFALTQMEFDLSTVAAVLMIAGYSINDTVVVFDRIRENLRKYKKMPLPELFNMSVNDMLSRTVMTSLTTILALVALYVFGGEVIRGFVDALIVGIVIGTYSSVFVAAPVLIYMNIRRTPVQDDDPNIEGGEPKNA